MDFRATGVRSLTLNMILILNEVKTNLISCYINVTQGIIMIVLINTIFLPLCKQKLYMIAIFCIGSSSVLLVIQYFYQFSN